MASNRPWPTKMHEQLPRDLTCILPYKYYTCASIQYLGCCSVDACVSHGCPDSATQTSSSIDSQTGAAPIITVTTPSSMSLTSIVFPTTQDPGSIAAPTSTQSSSENPAPTQTASSSDLPTSADRQSASTSPYDTNSQTTSLATSIEAPVTILITSVIYLTPTSHGVTLSPMRSLTTSTSTSLIVASGPSSSLPVIATPPKFTVSPDSGTTSNTSIIAGATGGGLGGILAAVILLWLLWRWRRAKSTAEEKKRQAYDNDPRFQGIDANRAGETFGRLSGKF